MDNGYSLSDLRAATGDGNGFGGNGAWWIVILFLFCFMGGGFWGNRQGEFGQYATAASQQEILFGQHFGQLNDRLTNLGNGVCNLGAISASRCRAALVSLARKWRWARAI